MRTGAWNVGICVCACYVYLGALYWVTNWVGGFRGCIYVHTQLVVHTLCVGEHMHKYV